MVKLVTIMHKQIPHANTIITMMITMQLSFMQTQPPNTLSVMIIVKRNISSHHGHRAHLCDALAVLDHLQDLLLGEVLLFLTQHTLRLQSLHVPGQHDVAVAVEHIVQAQRHGDNAEQNRKAVRRLENVLRFWPFGHWR